MAEIVCPGCERTTELLAIRRSAEEFCQYCDFPLFWAPSNLPAPTPSTSVEASRRRLPGAGGRVKVGSRDCWSCGELNSFTDTHCHRCGEDLDPPVEVEQVVIPDLPPVPVPEIDEPPWWRWLILGGGVVAVVAIVVALAWI